ncbi:MAG TPA: sulfatase/phosphatase domain-containing protein, partial [Tepidisphaeraceae bacterium]|nr:sulfatase/phosphatase domain-containing protein [Tepidisphaeraceae bacterium]
HTVRTDRWRYTEWVFGSKGRELYDHTADPQELHNLTDDPKSAPVIAEMKALLKQVHPSPVTGGKAEKDTKKKFCD